VTTRYAHFPDRTLIAAADQVAEAIAEALGGGAGGRARQAHRSMLGD
jgi:hypothetical protein